MDNLKAIAEFPPGTRIKLLNDGRLVVIEPDCPPKIGRVELMLNGEFQLQMEEIVCNPPKDGVTIIGTMPIGSILEWENHGPKG